MSHTSTAMAMSDFITQANAAVQLSDLVPEADRHWQVFSRALELFERLSRDQVFQALDATLEAARLRTLSLSMARLAARRFPEDGRAWYHLGFIELLHDRQSPTAYRHLERAWQLAPDRRLDWATCLSASYLAVQRWEDAERICRFEIQANPGNADAHSNLSITLRNQYACEAAVAAAREALQLDAAHDHAPLNLALALSDCGDHAQALMLLRKRLQLTPNDDRYRLAMGELEIRLGEWDKGWANMHARFSLPGLREQLQAREQSCGVPHWRGESLKGKTLGIWLEQGYGDAILLIRYLPLFAEQVRRQGGKLIFGCFGPLLDLFRPLIPADVEVDADHLRATDYHLPLMSGCAAFGIVDYRLPGTAYLRPEQQRVATWRESLKGDTRKHIALAWTGNPEQVRNAVRSLDAPALRMLLATPGVLFHSVNPAVAAQVRELAEEGFPIVDQSARLASFADTAALFAAVDGVVSTCTSTAHLGGAIGAPTLMLLDKVGSYLWACDEHRTPWYDSVQIIRQTQLGDWTTAIRCTVQALNGGPTAAAEAAVIEHG